MYTERRCAKGIYVRHVNDPPSRGLYMPHTDTLSTTTPTNSWFVSSCDMRHDSFIRVTHVSHRYLLHSDAHELLTRSYLWHETWLINTQKSPSPKCRPLVRKITYKDRGSYGFSPQCTHIHTHVCAIERCGQRWCGERRCERLQYKNIVKDDNILTHLLFYFVFIWSVHSDAIMESLARQSHREMPILNFLFNVFGIICTSE